TPAASPAARWGAALAVLGSKLVLFGGTTSTGQMFADTWTWDGINWVPQSPAASPTGREGHAMTTLGTKVVLFGGFDLRLAYGDTWEWDGTNWTPRSG